MFFLHVRKGMDARANGVIATRGVWSGIGTRWRTDDKTLRRWRAYVMRDACTTPQPVVRLEALTF